MIELTTVEGVSVLRMATEENRLDGPMVTALAVALDDAADPGGPLVLTGAGKFFCNGLDLGWLGAASPEEAAGMFDDLHRVLAMLLRFPGATVAAINGHAFGAGAILAAAMDYRVQRADRGYFCFPEVDLGLSMSDQFDAVLKAKLPSASLLQALLTGRRYSGEAALEAGFVDAVATEDRLLDTAIGLVRDLVHKSPATSADIKAQLHKGALAVIDPAS